METNVISLLLGYFFLYNFIYKKEKYTFCLMLKNWHRNQAKLCVHSSCTDISNELGYLFASWKRN